MLLWIIATINSGTVGKEFLEDAGVINCCRARTSSTPGCSSSCRWATINSDTMGKKVLEGVWNGMACMLIQVKLLQSWNTELR